MNTLAAQEIKRRGLAAIDSLIERGPIHLIRNNQPQYVVLTETYYQELLETEKETHLERVKAALTDIQAGRVRRFKSVSALMKAIKEVK